MADQKKPDQKKPESSKASRPPVQAGPPPRLKAHDESGQAHVGDRVRIVETRPLSKSKRWRVVEVLERAK